MIEMTPEATMRQHADNVSVLDEMMLDLDRIAGTLDHDGARQFCEDALVAVRNLRAVEAVLCFTPADIL